MKLLIRIALWITAIAAIVGAGLYLTIFEPWTVPSDDAQEAASIEPGLTAGDTVILSRRTTSEVGSLVRCVDPDAPARFVVGRIVAGSGAAVDIENGVVRVNNHSPSAPTGCDPVTIRNPATQEDIELKCSNEELGGSTHQALGGPLAEKDTHLTVPTLHVFLVSDDRTLHLDSRDFGPIAPTTCQAILYRIWSSDEKKRMSVVW